MIPVCTPVWEWFHISVPQPVWARSGIPVGELSRTVDAGRPGSSPSEHYYTAGSPFGLELAGSFLWAPAGNLAGVPETDIVNLHR